MLVAAGAAGCGAPAQAGAAGQAGYLASGRSTVAYLHGPAAQRIADRQARGPGGTSLAGSLELLSLSGVAPHQSVITRNYPFSGQLHGSGLTIRIGGRTAHGLLTSRTLTIGPLPGLAGARVFALAGAGRYSRAVTLLRDRAARADTVAGLAAQAAADRSQRRRGSADQVAAAAISVRQARRVVSRQLTAMATVAGSAAGALGKARRDTQLTVARARAAGPRVQVCDQAVMVGADAVGVSAYAAGMGADAASLTQSMSVLRREIAGLAAWLAELRQQRPGYHGDAAHPGTALAAQKLSSARQRVTVVLADANGYIAVVNRYVARAYLLSGTASRARHCGSASAAPAPLRRVSLGVPVTAAFAVPAVL